VFELQGAATPPKQPYRGGPKGQTGAVFTLHTYRNSGTYRLAAQCEGYSLATTLTFEWNLKGMGCGTVAELGVITATPEELPRPPVAQGAAAEEADFARYPAEAALNRPPAQPQMLLRKQRRKGRTSMVTTGWWAGAAARTALNGR
jgi:hypothetical protein